MKVVRNLLAELVFFALCIGLLIPLFVAFVALILTGIADVLTDLMRVAQVEVGRWSKR